MLNFKKLFQRRLPPVKAQDLMEVTRARRLAAEAEGVKWIPRGTLAAPAINLDIGGGVVILNASPAQYLPVTASRRALARETYSKHPTVTRYYVTVQDGDAIERLPPVEMVWARLRLTLPRWTGGLLLATMLGGCGAQCQVLAEKVAAPVQNYTCTVGSVSIRIQAGALIDASSDAGVVRCYEVVLP